MLPYLDNSQINASSNVDRNTYNGGQNAYGQTLSGFNSPQLPGMLNTEPGMSPNQKNQFGSSGFNIQNQGGQWNINGMPGYMFGLGLTPAQQQQVQTQQGILRRLSNLQAEASGYKAPTSEEAGLTSLIQQNQAALMPLNIRDYYNQTPGLKDVGITEGGLERTVAQQRAPIETALSNLLMSRSALQQNRQQMLESLGAQTGSLEAQSDISRQLSQLGSMGQQLPAGVAGGLLSQAFGANLSAPIMEYNQALQRGLIPEGTPFQEAQFLLHPESRFAQEMILNPTTGLPEMHMIDKLQALRATQGGGQGTTGVTTPISGGTRQAVQDGAAEQNNFKTAIYPLQPPQKEGAAQAATTFQNARDIMDLLETTRTGPVSGRLQEFGQYLGLTGADYNKLASKLTDFKANYIKALGGVRALSPQETQMLSPAFPDKNLPENVNKDRLTSLLEDLRNSMKSIGIDVNKFPGIFPQGTSPIKTTGTGKKNSTSGGNGYIITKTQ